MEFKITRNTWAKKSTAQANSLPENQKAKFDKDWSGEGEIIEYKDNHVQIKIWYGAGTWYFYNEHIAIHDQARSRTSQALPYNSQLDNPVKPHYTCNSSAHYMMARSIKPNLDPDDSQYVRDVMSGKFGYGNTSNPSIYWDVHVKGLKSMGVNIAVQSSNWDGMLSQVEQGILTTTNLLHRGHISNPTGGHVVCIAKIGSDRLFIHDPYGELDYINGISNLNASGQYWVSIANFKKRWQGNWSKYLS